MALPKVKIRIPRKPHPILPAPHRPRADTGNEAEALSGSVQGVKASAPEERLAKALDGQRTSYQFRYTVGAPRGLPGWKEVDFIIAAFSQYFAVEVDTAFTHREKGRADVLHDAIVLHELKKEGMPMFPTVLHVDGESDLATRENALRWVKEHFPPSATFETIQAEEAPRVEVRPQLQPQTPPVQVQRNTQPSTYRQVIRERQIARRQPAAPASSSGNRRQQRNTNR